MKSHTRVSLWVCLALLSIAPAALSQTVTPIHSLVCDSTAVGSCALGPNSEQDIVGFCLREIDPGPPRVTWRDGWMLRGGVMTSIVPAGSPSTAACGKLRLGAAQNQLPAPKRRIP
jgi:hypothetical protein